MRSSLENDSASRQLKWNDQISENLEYYVEEPKYRERIRESLKKIKNRAAIITLLCIAIMFLGLALVFWFGQKNKSFKVCHYEKGTIWWIENGKTQEMELKEFGIDTSEFEDSRYMHVIFKNEGGIGKAYSDKEWDLKMLRQISISSFVMIVIPGLMFLTLKIASDKIYGREWKMYLDWYKNSNKRDKCEIYEDEAGRLQIKNLHK